MDELMLRAVWICSALLVAAAASAQEAPAVELTPPRLLESVEPDYPAEARATRLEGRVLLELTIDVEGKVSEASVLESAGHGFDEAAREAALQFRFAPARRAGTPMHARIRYPVVFVPAPVPVPVPVPESPPLPAAPPSSPPTAAHSTEGPIQIEVRGRQREADRLRDSAEAVQVVDTRIAKQRAADLGEVLAHTPGVAVQREGGLGSETQFAIGGLYDEQVRFFVDGVPLEQAGYPLGIADIPVNLLDHVEVYRGVVPMRFGADALGGAVNLVTDSSFKAHLNGSYQLGSFGTRRVTALARTRLGPSGLVAGASSYFDFAKNNYEVDVLIPDETLRVQPATVRRQHDQYLAYGGNIEAGVIDRRWAKRLLLRGFATAQEKDIQHNITMTTPYGELRTKSSQYGATLRYDVELVPELELGLVGNYAHSTENFIDTSNWVYDWYGRRIRMIRLGGETNALRQFDLLRWNDTWFGRALLQWRIAPDHALRLAVTTKSEALSGDERIQRNSRARDPATAKRDLLTVISGLEYELELFEDRVSNLLFGKHYLYRMNSEDPPLQLLEKWSTTEQKRDRFGFGDALRVRVTPWLSAKASYEFATRFPTPQELFGDDDTDLGPLPAVEILENPELQPEISHNGNLGLVVELERSAIGDISFETNAFARDTDNVIQLVPGPKTSKYENIASSRGLGLENALAWESPDRRVSLNGMFTWQDIRSTSSKGSRGMFKGQRIPNQPYLFASWGGSVSFDEVLLPGDRLIPFYDGRYVHAFYRSWESLGLPQYKLGVPAQVTHTLGLTWLLKREFALLSATLELDNLTDEEVYDTFGAQRPGRAFYLKLTGEVR